MSMIKIRVGGIVKAMWRRFFDFAQAVDYSYQDHIDDRISHLEQEVSRLRARVEDPEFNSRG